ncbi:MAG: inositol monophosphatase [Firmicutes bacterium]|nr:inositol monophosphatase [Bacillota bacterium]
MQNATEKILKVAESAARQAGDIIINKKGSSSFSEKGDNNLVTEADYAAQETIIKIISEQYPDHSFIAEENDLTANINEPDLWVIDPLDGTNNYAHQIPHFSVSIAYARFGQVKAGVVFDPERGELFSAAESMGTTLNGKKITVSRALSLQEAIVATGFYYDRGVMMRKTLSSIEKLFAENIHGIRRFGSAALDLCWVACGRFDAYFEYKLAVWDFAAGLLIVNEAGGNCTDQQGNPLTLSSSGIVVSNSILHRELLNIVGWDRDNLL